jgi:hypothetical protein
MIGRIFGIGCSFAAFESGGGRASTGRAFALAAAFRIRARTSGLGAGEDVIAPRIRGEALPTTTLQCWESGTRPWGFTHAFRPATAFRAVAAAVVAAGIAAAFRVPGGADSTSSVRDAIPKAAARGRSVTGIAARTVAVSVLEGAIVVTGGDGIGGVSIAIVIDAGAPAGGDEAVAAGGAGGVVTAGGAGWSLTMSFVDVGSAGLGSVASGAPVPNDEEPAGDSELGSASGAGAGASGLASVEVGEGVAAGGVSAGVGAAGGVSAGGGGGGADSAPVVTVGGGGGGASSANAVGTATSTATADASEVAPTRATQPARFPLAANGVSSVTEWPPAVLPHLSSWSKQTLTHEGPRVSPRPFALWVRVGETKSPLAVAVSTTGRNTLVSRLSTRVGFWMRP